MTAPLLTSTSTATATASATSRPTGPSLAGLTGIEMRKTVSTRSGRALAVVALLFGPTAMALAAATGEPMDGAASPIGVVGMLTGLVLLSFGVLSTAGEWSHRTVQTTFLLVPGRGRVLASKAAAVAALGAAFALASGLLGALVLLVSEGDQLGWDGSVRALVAVTAAGAAFALIGAGAGAALANTPAALTSLYLFVLGVLPVVRMFEPGIGDNLDPTGAAIALAQGQSQTKAIVILAGWVVVTWVAGVLLTRRRAVQ